MLFELVRARKTLKSLGESLTTLIPKAQLFQLVLVYSKLLDVQVVDRGEESFILLIQERPLKVFIDNILVEIRKLVCFTVFLLPSEAPLQRQLLSFSGVHICLDQVKLDEKLMVLLITCVWEVNLLVGIAHNSLGNMS